MRLHAHRLAPVMLLVAVALAAGGCQRLKTKLGIGEKITNPDPGSPEKVLQDVLKAAKNPDEEEGWQMFVQLLHSEEVALPSTLNDWRTMRYPAIRRKVDYFLQDKIAYTYTLMDRREEGRSLSLYIENTASDTPTPCRFRQDPAQGNAWKIFNNCL